MTAYNNVIKRPNRVQNNSTQNQPVYDGYNNNVQNNHQNLDFSPDESFNIPNTQANKPNAKPNQILNLLKQKKKIFLIAFLLLLVFAIVISLAFVFGNNSQPGQMGMFNINNNIYDNVKVDIIAPNNLPQGTPGEWEVRIENLEPVALTNIKLELNFDSGFNLIQAFNPSPEDTKGRVYSLPRLDPVGGRATSARVNFQGSLSANIDIETEMGGVLSYVPDFGNGNLGQLTEVSIRRARTKVTSPRVQLNLEFPRNSIENGNQTELTVVIENISDQEIRDLRLRLIYPTGRDSFTYLSSEYVRADNTTPITQPDDGDDIWFITRLPSGSRQTVKVQGTVSGSDNSRLSFGAELSTKSQSGVYQALRSVYRDITIIAQPLSIQTSILGKQAGGLIQAGETLQIEVSYKNQSNRPVENVEIFAFLDDPGNMLDLNTLNFSGGERGDLSGTELVWRSPRVPSLLNILPNQSGSFNYSVRVKNDFISSRLNQQSYVITPGVRARARNINEIANTGTTHRASGSFTFTALNPERIGINPQTNDIIYRITWRLSNTQNEIQEAEVRAILPIVGAWNENTINPVSAKSSISHNENTGEIIWRVGRLESYTGIVRTPVEISFDLEVGQNERELLRNLRASGTDVFTGQRFDESRGNVGIRG